MIIGLDIGFLLAWTLISFSAGGFTGIYIICKMKNKNK
jgi:hypothetical protein